MNRTKERQLSPGGKYRPYPGVDLPRRQWPQKTVVRAPLWCSVDLRDGNQALRTPMTVDDKLELFALLVERGFKEIEVGFPSASQTEFAFTRELIERDLVPEDVTIQVLTQSREHVIRRTFESLRGAHRAIVHLYNSTSTLQRRVVFGMSRREIVAMAVEGTRIIREEAGSLDEAEILFEYSPESFTGTELDFAVDICEAVMEAWAPGPGERVILNLPATVEMSTPNVYADRIEWFCRQLRDRHRAVISVHTHNDRGTAVAATELALLAGAERVEGTLFGNGERTGNADIVTLALNLFSQGIDPRLDFSDIDEVTAMYERCTGMVVHPRHPYAGELVYTAFSGSHQDAIGKGMRAMRRGDGRRWEVPYLPIDPGDVGRTCKSIIRINSQSGKGGVSHVLEYDFGFVIPKKMHPEVGALIQGISDRTGGEVTPEMIWEAFSGEYLGREEPYGLAGCRIAAAPEGPGAESRTLVSAEIRNGERLSVITGRGNGPIDAFCDALRREEGLSFRLTSYHEHALGEGSSSQAVSYIGIEDREGRVRFGVGIDSSISLASFKALLCALNRVAAS